MHKSLWVGGRRTCTSKAQRSGMDSVRNRETMGRTELYDLKQVTRGERDQRGYYKECTTH